jgi:ketosteroid isomerase-like protein
MPDSVRDVVASFVFDVEADASGGIPAESLVEGLASGVGEWVDPDVELSFVGPEYAANRQTYRGIEEVTAGWRDWGEVHESYRLVPQEIVEIEDGVLFLGRGVTRTRTGGVEMQHQAAAIFRAREGKIVAVELYLDWDQARAAAGLTGDS